ncbi:RVP domain-containing protein [Trichonephila clavipes]|uniref:RVP domain-containing protein n=1 Tax=Trichonephila clavipes TaxID=2585209 RepID=A0A8X6SUV9_TRICX|nr:RVP domain-containing protein [Trichonephila clavipes]
MNHQEKSSITRKIRSFSVNELQQNIYEAYLPEYESVQRYQRQRAERVKITALIDSGSTVSLLRENTSRRIMDPTKLSKNKMLLTAVIGSDLLEQASISFTKEGVKFHKYENQAQLMQISAENLQEELDLRHVENRRIKKELEKLIQDYKPEKTASTDITMRIILKDEEPVCQPPRRLAFTERQEVNKQIEEWLNEGIIRPSSAEYASQS